MSMLSNDNNTNNNNNSIEGNINSSDLINHSGSSGLSKDNMVYYEHQNQSHLSNKNNSNSVDKSKRRNVWTEKKNAALVEIVKNCPYPTPWRPKHGTAKEIWQEITRQMSNLPEIFDKPVHWEAAKEHLLLIMERQKMRRSLGDFEVKTQTEKYVDEMIKHTLAEDAERAAALIRKDKMSNNLRRSIDNVQDDRKRKHVLLENNAPDSLLQLSNGSDIDGQDDNSLNLEREKLKLELELQKEKLRHDRDKERDELLIHRDQEFIKFVQDQLVASQQLFQTTNDLLTQLLNKLDSSNH